MSRVKRRTKPGTLIHQRVDKNLYQRYTEGDDEGFFIIGLGPSFAWCSVFRRVGYAHEDAQRSAHERAGWRWLERTHLSSHHSTTYSLSILIQLHRFTYATIFTPHLFTPQPFHVLQYLQESGSQNMEVHKYDEGRGGIGGAVETSFHSWFKYST